MPYIDYHTCWKTEIDALFKMNGDTWDDVEANTMSYAAMIEEFDAGFGGVEGCAFTLWTKKYVYFPVCYDGAESVAYVSRHPNGKPTAHVGG